MHQSKQALLAGRPTSISCSTTLRVTTKQTFAHELQTRCTLVPALLHMLASIRIFLTVKLAKLHIISASPVAIVIASMIADIA